MTTLLRQYTWDEILFPVNSDVPITDDQFEQLMAPSNEQLIYNDPNSGNNS